MLYNNMQVSIKGSTCINSIGAKVLQFLDFFLNRTFTCFILGSVVLINVFVGGGPYNQIRGTTLGALIVGLGLLITGFAKFNNPTVIIVGLIPADDGRLDKRISLIY